LATLVVPDCGHALTTRIVALHAFYRLVEVVARRRGRILTGRRT
jgi:hypothetical protein